ncbi:uncharacterized protein MONBRDRAFT_17929 [Monosiga brevicollis MX1]|uniref:Chromatin-modifying protein 1a n=1 Tax=Monosiga brevicollis TaxID=81824 RepID=A9UT80_MONBE|nr:uncharacterized protein MONBRDRAFT_17929 [Monosiga brevicollis MX1]EDQ91200.1 predicted protein [Monosiga brevicollis MX1]|eukprot:XP_001743622.1 hypothetical protein [Monosiga brevicollis MX1]
MGQEQSVNMSDVIFNLKMTQKQLERQSKKSEKDMEKSKRKVKDYLEKGNQDAARVMAESAIRQKSEATNYLRMSSRIDATVSRLNSAMSMKQVSQQMGSVVKGMDKAMASMDLEKASGRALAAVMDKFESQFEELDVRTGVMDNAMSSAFASSAPEDQIDNLLQQVADESNMDLAAAFAPAGRQAVPDQAQADPSQAEQDELSQRLAALRS